MNVDIEAWVRLANNLQCTRSHTMRTFLLPRMYVLHTQIPGDVSTTFDSPEDKDGAGKRWRSGRRQLARVAECVRVPTGGRGAVPVWKA